MTLKITPFPFGKLGGKGSTLSQLFVIVRNFKIILYKKFLSQFKCSNLLRYLRCEGGGIVQNVFSLNKLRKGLVRLSLREERKTLPPTRLLQTIDSMCVILTSKSYLSSSFRLFLFFSLIVMTVTKVHGMEETWRLSGD